MNMGWLFGLKTKVTRGKVGNVECTIQALELHGCMFPGSPCCTWTETNGNVLCSLMSFIFQHVTSTRPYRVMYLQYEQYNEVIICTKMIRNLHYEQYGSLRESLQRCIMKNKCSSKPEFNASMVLLPFPEFLQSLEVTM